MKKRMILVLALLLAGAMVISASQVPVMGDVSGEGQVTVQDAILVLRYVAKLVDAVDEDLADVSGDGTVTVQDAILVLRYVAKLIDEFPNQGQAPASEGLEFTLNEDGVSYAVSGLGTCTDTDIVIPDTYEGLPVTRIGSSAFDCDFYEVSHIVSITIPDSVTEIGAWAFYGCTGLTSVDIPDGVTSIGYCVFYGCTGLTSIDIPDGVTVIGDGAFYSCTGLTCIDIPDVVTSIGEYAFFGCTGLTSVDVPNNVAEIGYGAFIGCVDTLVLYYDGTMEQWKTISWNPEGHNLTVSCTDGELYYVDCTDHSWSEWVTVEESSCTEDGVQQRTCTLCGTTEQRIIQASHSWGEWLVVKESSCTEYGVQKRTCPVCGQSEERTAETMAYHNYNDEGVCTVCGKKVSVGLRFALSSDETYYILKGQGECTGSNIVIPENYNGLPVKEIHDYAIGKGIVSIEIPNTVSIISYQAFESSTDLVDVNYVGTVEQWLIIDFQGRWSNPCCHSANLCFFGDKIIDLTIPDGVRVISSMAFYGCRSLCSITIPGTVYSIDGGAFTACENLTNVYFEGSLEDWLDMNIETNPCEYGANLYVGGSLLTELVVPEGVTAIGDFAFEGCSSLTKLIIADGCSSIGGDTFAGCINLVEIVIPDSVEVVGTNAFDGCAGLELDDGVYYADNWAVDCVDNMGVMVLREGTAGVANDAFCDSTVTRVILPVGIKIIGERAFAGCKYLDYIEIPETVSEIFDGAFYGCESMTSIVIPEGITHIGWNMFADCEKLRSVTLPGSVISLGPRSFEGCYSLEVINFNGTMEQWKNVLKADYPEHYLWDGYTGDYVVCCTDGELEKGDWPYFGGGREE